MELTSVIKRDSSVILGITKTAEKLVFSDSHDYSVKFCNDGNVIHSLGGSQPARGARRFYSWVSFAISACVIWRIYVCL